MKKTARKEREKKMGSKTKKTREETKLVKSVKRKETKKKIVGRIDVAEEFKKASARKQTSGSPKTTREQRGQTIRLTVRGLQRGAVRMEAEDGTAFACARENAMGTLWGDTVLAERIGRERVIVVKVISRAHEEIIGVLGTHRGERTFSPIERRLPQSIAVDSVACEAEDGDIVRARVVRWEDEGGMSVRAEERIGSFDQATFALDGLVAAARLRTSFDDEVLRQADGCRPADLADDPAREDLRALVSFTIDGRDAKDFDDAVSLEELGHGSVRLGVHIADVGHYVKEGTPLDREAFARGTSVYLPGRVLPMLPEQLSNGVCSLRPQEDKFTLSALVEIDAEGAVVCTRLARTITRSNARLVYDDVNALFEGDAVQRDRLSALEPTLLAMRALAKKLRARRQAQGCIDFETEEPQFVLDEAGEPVEIVKRERGEAEMMIEDFMLTANEAVARFAKQHGVPLLYRVHEKPDPEKLAVFTDFLDGLGVDTRGITRSAQPGDIRNVLEKTKERPEYSVISTLALRSMQKARYDVRPLGHYGLAMADYCHFTSPIRRYPDLVVSRALTAVLTGKRAALTGDALEEAALHSSDRERAAIEAERAADKLMMARLMASHVGEVFDGAVSGVSEWGVYVALQNGAEGFIHVRTLDDWFDYDERRMTLRGERTGVVFSLGQALTVRVDSVELTTSSVDLSLAAPLREENRGKSERKRERERMRSFHR